MYRVLVLKGWLVRQRRTTARPRVQGRRSRASRSNEPWAMDVTHIDCGNDGWAHLAVVLDCDDRELVGYEFARRGCAKEAELALEAACKDYRLRQESITPYSPEQIGMIERFFRSLKEECVWQHSFPSFVEARRAVRRWIGWYNDRRPHQALGHLSPRQYRARAQRAVA